MALEKRYNFSLDDLDVVANGYSHFLSYLQDEEGKCVSYSFHNSHAASDVNLLAYNTPTNDADDKDFEYRSSPCFVGKCMDLSLIPLKSVICYLFLIFGFDK